MFPSAQAQFHGSAAPAHPAAPRRPPVNVGGLHAATPFCVCISIGHRLTATCKASDAPLTFLPVRAPGRRAAAPCFKASASDSRVARYANTLARCLTAHSEERTTRTPRKIAQTASAVSVRHALLDAPRNHAQKQPRDTSVPAQSHRSARAHPSVYLPDSRPVAPAQLRWRVPSLPCPTASSFPPFH